MDRLGKTTRKLKVGCARFAPDQIRIRRIGEAPRDGLIKTRTGAIKPFDSTFAGQEGSIGFVDFLISSARGSPWMTIDNPATRPGQTPGQIIRLGMAEAAARGVETPTLNFDDDEDSAGDPWDDTIPLSYRVPTTELDVLDSLAPWIEFEIPDNGYTLNAYNIGTGVGAASGVEFGNVIVAGVNGTA